MEGEEGLPQVYDPETISAYWGKRPGSVATRIAQLLGVAGGFLSRIAWDIATKKVKEVGLCTLLCDFGCFLDRHEGNVFTRIYFCDTLRHRSVGEEPSPLQCILCV